MNDALPIFSIIRTGGGLGIFLLGMILMTDSLRAIAGQRLQSTLMAFTRSPVTGAATGAITTAVLQSSSATTVAAVGFVGSGLMTFSSALGIIFGANLGTTITGWIVALVGFKLQLIAIMLPCILIGALMRLLLTGRTAVWGMAIAGFGLIFVGIDQMQLGMVGMRDLLDGIAIPTDTAFGRLKLVLIGAVFTMLTQSSSAGVAAVLTGVYADAFTLTQGLALVVGMDIGTTVTAVLATVGGSVNTRRTGYSHMIYNLMTGTMAFLLIVPYVRLWEALSPAALDTNTEFVLVGFHSAFNLIGVLAVLPFTRQFEQLVTALVPDKGSRYSSPLDRNLLKDRDAAMQAVKSSVVLEFNGLMAHALAILGEEKKAKRINLARMQTALDETHHYLGQISTDELHREPQKEVSLFHILDHLQRLHERLDEDEYRAKAATRSERLAGQHRHLVDTLAGILASIETSDLEEAARIASANHEQSMDEIDSLRAAIMNDLAAGKCTVTSATSMLEALRWMRRVGYHLAQTCHYLKNLG